MPWSRGIFSIFPRAMWAENRHLHAWQRDPSDPRLFNNCGRPWVYKSNHRRLGCVCGKGPFEARALCISEYIYSSGLIKREPRIDLDAELVLWKYCRSRGILLKNAFSSARFREFAYFADFIRQRNSYNLIFRCFIQAPAVGWICNRLVTYVQRVAYTRSPMLLTARSSNYSKRD
jgi:hypothetical protein